jgi:hypothetical protein
VGEALVTRGDWADFLLVELGRWFLAVRAWERRDELPEDVVADLRVVLGWTQRTDEVAEASRVRDRWHVVGLRRADDDRIQSQRTWLVGEHTGEWCTVLDFASAGAVLPVAQVLGTVVDAEMIRYPGTRPWRVAFEEVVAVVGTTSALPSSGALSEALDRAAASLGENPWSPRSPMALRDVTVVHDDTTFLRDVDGRYVPVAGGVDSWRLLALTGGHPGELFGEWEDGRFVPLSVVVDGKLVPA